MSQGRSGVGHGPLGSQVLGPGRGHAGLVHGDHGTVGVGDQAVERCGGDDRETRDNNLENREILFLIQIIQNIIK